MLQADCIHQWCVDIVDVERVVGVTSLREVLSEDERARAQVFRRPQDRDRYIVTRALVRSVLTSYLGSDPTEWSFISDRGGKPLVANPSARVAGLRFNVSHSREMVIMSVAMHRELGVDIEEVVPSRSVAGTAQYVLTPHEREDLERFHGPFRELRFLEYWTLKESYLKARSLGVGASLRTIGFTLDDKEMCIKAHVLDTNDSSSWLFWQFRFADGYIGALCVEGVERSVPLLRFFRCVPLVSSTEVRIVPYRRPTSRQ